MPKTIATTLLVLLVTLTVRAGAPQQTDREIDRRFTQTVQPFIKTYCFECHAGSKPEADLSLDAYRTMDDVVQDHARWAQVLEKLTAEEMPPADRGAAPDAGGAERGDRMDRGDAQERSAEARGRPRRGARPAAEQRRVQLHDPRSDRRRHPAGARVPRRPGQPGRLRQLRRIARDVARAADQVSAGRARGCRITWCCKPDGHRVRAAPDARRNGSRQVLRATQIIDFYERQDTDYADYFEAAWRYKHRAALGKPKATLADVAAESRVSPKYLATVWSTLEQTRDASDPWQGSRRCGEGFPAAKAAERRGAGRARSRCATLSSGSARSSTPRVTNISVKGISGTAQPFLMWRNQQVRDTSQDVRARRSAGGRGIHGRCGSRLAHPRSARRPATRPRSPFCLGLPRRVLRFRARPQLPRQHPRYGPASQRRLPQPDGLLPRRPAAVRAGARRRKASKSSIALWQELDFVASANIRTYVQFYFNESGEARGPAANRRVLAQRTRTSPPKR